MGLRTIGRAAAGVAGCVLAACAARPLPEGAVASPIGAFEDLLRRVNAAPPGGRAALVDAYAASAGSSPLVGGERAIFLWRGEAETVQVAGDMNGWDLAKAPAMTRVPGTDLWHLEIRAESDARLDYKFVADGRTWLLDPRNPRRVTGGFGANSELAMPAYRLPPELAALEAGSRPPARTMERHVLHSVVLDEDREFFVYTPPVRDPTAELGSVYFHDGSDYLKFASAERILDVLIAGGEVPPLVAVFVPPRRRGDEYVLNDAYVRFLADELVPWVRERYGTSADPRRTATAGPSAGGLVAAYASLVRPDVFGLAACQSGAFSLRDDAVIKMLGERERVAVRFHLVVGTYETALGGDGDEGNLLAAARRANDVLRTRGYDAALVEVHEGHSWGLWRAYLGEALRWLFRRPVSDPASPRTGG